MASKNDRQIRFQLSNSDYKAFGRYRILYTKSGRRLINRQRFTYALSGALLALLFTVFKVDASFTRLVYIIAAVIGIGGIVFADKLVLKQQNAAIEADADNPGRVHPLENIITFEEDFMHTKAGDDEQRFSYSDIKQVDMTEDAIYVWMSDTMIMPLPLHAFKSEKAMEELYKWISDKTEKSGS
ncbi:MAG: YcxB family protein [Mogibacterium sp.]|nr:YcxB family protein [Mogibacterium sp.]